MTGVQTCALPISNGDVKNAKVQVTKPDEQKSYFKQEKVEDIKTKWEQTITDLNCCSQKGLVERFDSSIGANTVIMPFGGKYQLTPATRNGSKNTYFKRIYR